MHLLEELVGAPDRLDDLHLDQLVLGGHVVELLVVRLLVVAVEQHLELGGRLPRQRVAPGHLGHHRVRAHRELLLQVALAAGLLQVGQPRQRHAVRDPAGPVQVLVEREDGRPLQQRLRLDRRRLGRPVAGLVVRLRRGLVGRRRRHAARTGREPERLRGSACRHGPVGPVPPDRVRLVRHHRDTGGAGRRRTGDAQDAEDLTAGYGTVPLIWPVVPVLGSPLVQGSLVRAPRVPSHATTFVRAPARNRSPSDPPCARPARERDGRGSARNP